MTNAVHLFQGGWRGFAAVALGATVGLGAFADTAFQGLWSQTDGNCIWTVAEDGTWSFGGWLTGHVNSIGAGWLYQGVVYTPRITDTTDGAQKVTVLRYPSANLPVLSAPGAKSFTGVAVTPDGAWCYLLTNVGLYRYDLSTGTGGEWSLVDAETTRGPRALAVDDAGHVFITIRDNGYTYYGSRADIRCYEAATGTKVWQYRHIKSDSDNGPTGICWNPADNYVYWTTTARHVFRMPANGDTTKLESYTFSGTEGGDGLGGWGQGLTVFNGTFYMNYYNTSTVRITTFVWPLSDDAPSSFASQTVSKGKDGWGLMVERTQPTAKWQLADGEPSLIGRGGFRKGAVTPATYGVASGAGYFAGANAYAYLDGSQALLPATNDFTLTFWVYLPALETAPATPRCLLSNDIGQNGALSVVADQGAANRVGLVFTTSAGETVSIAGGTVADGQWHQVSVCRRGATALELGLDGVRQGTAAIAETDGISQTVNWHFGCNGDATAGLVGIGAALGEIRLYGKALSVSELADLGAWQIYTDAPTDPGAPGAADPMPAQFGTEIAHAYVTEDAPFADPGLFIAADGTYYASVGKLGGVSQAGQATTIYRSTDRGASWSAWSALAATGVTLFESGGVLCAFGQKGTRTFAIWTFDGATGTEAASASAADGDFTMSPGAVSIGGGKVVKPVVKSFTPYSNEERMAWVAFAVDGSTFSNGGVVINDKTVEWASPTIRNMLPGHAVYLDSMAHAMNVIERTAYDTIPLCADQILYYAVQFDWKPAENPYGSMSNYRDLGMFRGGSAPFGLAYDSAAALVRTVSIADGKYVLQASQTARDWMPCGEIDVPTGGTTYAPAIAVDGDDLVMVTGVRCDDGAGGADLNEGGVYLGLRKIANFRTAYAPESPTAYSRKFVYSVNERGSVEQVWKASDGRWYQGKTFKKMYTSLGSYSLTSPMGVWYARRHYFLFEANKADLHVLDENGKWLKAIPMPAAGWWNEVAADKNGQNLTVRLDDHSLQAVDWRAGTCTTIIDTSSADWYKFGQFTVASDGTVYACGSQTTTSPYAYYRIDRIARDGTVSNIMSVYCTTAKWDSFGGVALDEAEENLYFITCKGVLRKHNLKTGVTTQIADYGFSSSSTCMELRFCDGKLVVSGNSGKTMQIDPATGELEPTEFGFVYQVRGMTFAERRKFSGCALILK